MSKNEVAVAEKAALPAHLQQGKTARLGNIDQSDLIIPRVKLMQAISPEVEEFEAAKSGEFWHTLAGESMGSELRFIPIVIRKSYTLWAPRGDDRGVLARAPDGVHWDKIDEFEVKPKGSPRKVTWKTAATVAESGLAKFGSSIPDDENSPPAAALTYNLLLYFPDHPELSPAVVINTRSSVRPCKALISKIEMRPVDHFAQVFIMKVTKENGQEGPYNNYKYVADGYADEETYQITKGLYEKFGQADWRASEEDDDTDGGSGGGGGGGGSVNEGMASKF